MASVTNTSSSGVQNWYNAATNNSSQTAKPQSSSGSNAGGTSALANESTFLQLLVAQLQNQDPTQPQDGVQFVTQLAQFSSLEQNLAMRKDLDSINTKMASTAATAGANSSDTKTGSSSGA